MNHHILSHFLNLSYNLNTYYHILWFNTLQTVTLQEPAPLQDVVFSIRKYLYIGHRKNLEIPFSLYT